MPPSHSLYLFGLVPTKSSLNFRLLSFNLNSHLLNSSLDTNFNLNLHFLLNFCHYALDAL